MIGFLILNFLYMFVEIIIGVYTNSLGLISDAGHMFFDCTALFISLAANFVSTKQPDLNYTYGYKRFEVLAGFVNAIFLFFVAFFILIESIERLSEPPELGTQGLFYTSVGGLFVNCIGICFFHEHSHGEHNHSHSHSHQSSSNGSRNHNHVNNNGYSKLMHDDIESGDHGHEPESRHHHEAHFNENMRGVFLHIFADLLGRYYISFYFL